MFSSDHEGTAIPPNEPQSVSTDPADTAEQILPARVEVDTMTPDEPPLQLAMLPRPTRPAPWPAPQPRKANRASPRVVLIAAGILVALALVGLGAAKLRGAAPTAATQTPTASRGTAAALGTATVVPTIPNFGVPTGHLSLGYEGALTSSQTCIGTDALPELTINLSNDGDVAVDWWVQIKQMLPDGKTLWAGPSPPYNTLPPGQTAQLKVQPDSGLCGELIGHSGKVQFTATVNYGGASGAFTITDTITPPPPGTSTPTPTVPPTPYS